jgi:hypothetical protein
MRALSVAWCSVVVPPPGCSMMFGGDPIPWFFLSTGAKLSGLYFLVGFVPGFCAKRVESLGVFQSKSHFGFWFFSLEHSNFCRWLSSVNVSLLCAPASAASSRRLGSQVARAVFFCSESQLSARCAPTSIGAPP